MYAQYMSTVRYLYTTGHIPPTPSLLASRDIRITADTQMQNRETKPSVRPAPNKIQNDDTWTGC
jgi:hypothetical protein